MDMTGLRMSGLIAAVGVAALVSAASAQAEPDPLSLGYCLPSNPAADPLDVPPGGSVRGSLPAGFTERAVTIGGVRTFVIEGGPAGAQEAVVLVHGNGGSGRDWVELLPGVSPNARVIAYDQPGFGHADKRRDIRYDLAAQTDFLEGLLDTLGIDRALVGGHDIGASVALEWAVRNPRQTAGAFIVSGGIAPGYQWHSLAQIWRTPLVGEAFMLTLNRQGWNLGLQQGQQQPLPREFVDRTYDDYDRLTRCAVLDTYRSEDSPSELGLRQAAALRPFDIPALVIWGRHDPYISADYAEQQQLGFPRAQVEIFEQAAHWPFVDEPDRVRSLLAQFTSQITEGATVSRPGTELTPTSAGSGQRAAALKKCKKKRSKKSRKRCKKGAKSLPL